MSEILFIDFETRSRVELKKLGVYVYAQDISTQVICCGYATLESEIKITDSLPEIFKSTTIFCAANIEFEKQILEQVWKFPTSASQWVDILALARYSGLPGNLSELGTYFGYPKSNNRAMLKLCKPNREGEFITPDKNPELYQELYAYNRVDVELLRHCYRNLPPLPKTEQKLFELTVETNEYGLAVNSELLRLAQKQLRNLERAANKKMKDLTGLGINQTVKLANFLQLPCLDKAAVRIALETETDPLKTEILQLRQSVGLSSTRKITAMLDRRIRGRVQGTLVYCGASRTGRWSGSGIQPQNFPRGFSNPENFIGVFNRLRTGEPCTAQEISNSLKGFIKGPLLIADYAQIEARILCWLANFTDLLDVFKAGGDPYIKMASSIYSTPEQDISTDQRFIGKQVVLGAGYGMGPVKFRSMLELLHGVKISTERAEFVIKRFRTASPKITNLWQTIGKAFIYSYTIKKPVKYRDLVFNSLPDSDTVTIRLPSGRKLYYHQVVIDTGQITYFGRGFLNPKFTRVKTYGAKLVENICQAVARDILAIAILRISDSGLRLLLTVHDEIVLEFPITHSILAVEQLLTKPPRWGLDIPLAVEIKRTEFYRK